MTAKDTLRQTLVEIFLHDDVRRATIESAYLVSIVAAVDYEGNRDPFLAPDSEALFSWIESALAAHGFTYSDSETDDADPGERQAVEAWIFTRTG